MTLFLRLFGWLGSIAALILLVVTLLHQLIALVGFLLTLIKVAIVLGFVVLIAAIVFAILRDRSRRRREAQEI